MATDDQRRSGRVKQVIYLETKHLLIRDHIADDLQPFHALVSDKEVMRYLPDIYCASIEGSERNLQTSIAEIHAAHRTKYFFAILERKSEQFVGAIGLLLRPEPKQNSRGNLGYFINKPFWGKGYTTEAAKAVLHFAFEDLGLHKVTTGCLRENAGSEAVMKKCGMIKEAELVQHSYHEGQWKDRVMYRLLKSEWNTKDSL